MCNIIVYNGYFLRLKIFAILTLKGIKFNSAFPISAITLNCKIFIQTKYILYIFFKFWLHLSCVFRNSAWGITTDTVYKGDVNFSLRNQPPVNFSFRNCRVVNVYLTISAKAKISLMSDIKSSVAKNMHKNLQMIKK